jgi:cell division protein FtsB
MAIDLPFSADRAKHLLVTFLCVAIIGYFVLHGVMGERGFVALSKLEYQVSNATTELTRIQTERKTLEARTRLLRPDGLDLDMLDERARATLGYTKPNEYVVLYGQKK